MTISANAQGVVAGKFTIPANVPAGTKRVTFAGSGGSSGSAVFVGSGTVTNETRQLTTTEILSVPGTTTVRIDPLAQTFSLAADQQIAAIDVWFAAIGTGKVLVQLRGTSNGIPTQETLATARLMPAQMNILTHTRVLFDAPVSLLAGTEYALVLMCDDAVSAARIAELGKWDITNGRWVTSQPYQVGVLLSSSNASTWTPHQDRDLAFRLHRALFTANEKTVELGVVAVVNATDLLLLSIEELPSSQTRIEYLLELPGGLILTVSGGQPVRLGAAITGNVTVSARLLGNSLASPVLFHGTQLVVGRVAASSNYITRAIRGGANVRVKAIFEAFIPGNATVTVAYRGVDQDDAWVLVPFTASTEDDNGFFEITHELLGVTEDMIQLRLTLTGTTAERPRVKNLRFMTI